MLGPVEGLASEAACSALILARSSCHWQLLTVHFSQVRNAQLDKEAAELRRESVELSHAAQEARNGVANSQEASLDVGL